MFGSNNSWFSIPDDAFSSINKSNSWGHESSNYERPETRRQRNEQITRDYFRNLYGADPWDVGLEVPDWKWDW